MQFFKSHFSYYTLIKLIHKTILNLKVRYPDKLDSHKKCDYENNRAKEVDFVVEHRKKLLAIETKLTQNPSLSDAKNLLTFIEAYPQTALLLHSGKSVRRLHTKVLAVPWWWL
jgi:predicted AAA+ superfamily ATPase